MVKLFFPPFLSDSRWFSVLVLPFFSASYFLFPLPLFFLSFLLPLFSLSSFSLLFSLLFPKGAQICRQDLRYADGNADLPTVSFLWSFFLSFLLPLFPLIFLHFFWRERRFAAVPPDIVGVSHPPLLYYAPADDRSYIRMTGLWRKERMLPLFISMY